MKKILFTAFALLLLAANAFALTLETPSASTEEAPVYAELTESAAVTDDAKGILVYLQSFEESGADHNTATHFDTLFETSGDGFRSTYGSGVNFMEVVDNPDAAGLNPSFKVLKLGRASAGTIQYIIDFSEGRDFAAREGVYHVEALVRTDGTGSTLDRFLLLPWIDDQRLSFSHGRTNEWTLIADTFTVTQNADGTYDVDKDAYRETASYTAMNDLRYIAQGATELYLDEIKLWFRPAVTLAFSSDESGAVMPDDGRYFACSPLPVPTCPDGLTFLYWQSADGSRTDTVPLADDTLTAVFMKTVDEEKGLLLYCQSFEAAGADHNTADYYNASLMEASGDGFRSTYGSGVNFMEVVDNPDAAGLNQSTKALKLGRASAGTIEYIIDFASGEDFRPLEGIYTTESLVRSDGAGNTLERLILLPWSHAERLSFNVGNTAVWTKVSHTFTVVKNADGAYEILEDTDRGVTAFTAVNDHRLIAQRATELYVADVCLWYKPFEAPETENEIGYRTLPDKGIRFKAVVSPFMRAAADSYGFLVTRDVFLAGGELTFDLARTDGSGKPAYAFAPCYDKAAGIDKIAAVDDDGSITFSAVAVNIPDDSADDPLSARPYVKKAGSVFYGATVSASVNSAKRSN